MSAFRAFLLLAVAGLVLLAAGCAGDSASSDDQAGSRPAFGGAQLGDDGRLIGDPAPLTVEDIQRQPEGSARRTVMELLFWAQWGSAPNVLSLYDRRVRKSVGVNGPSAYNLLRTQLMSSYPRIVEERTSSEGTFVGVELFSKNVPVQRESFLLRERRDGWEIIYDTLLDRALVVYIRFREQGDPSGSDPDPRAVKTAEEIARSYRSLFLQRESAAD